MTDWRITKASKKLVSRVSKRRELEFCTAQTLNIISNYIVSVIRMVRTRSADCQKKRAKPRSNTNVATNVRDATESQEPSVQPMDVPADVPVASTVTNTSALLVGDSMKQREGESILEFSLRTIGSIYEEPSLKRPRWSSSRRTSYHIWHMSSK